MISKPSAEFPKAQLVVCVYMSKRLLYVRRVCMCMCVCLCVCADFESEG